MPDERNDDELKVELTLHDVKKLAVLISCGLLVVLLMAGAVKHFLRQMSPSVD